MSNSAEPPASPPPVRDLTPALELNYQTPPPWGNAPLLVRLAAIFAFVTAGLDVLHVVSAGAASGFMYYLLAHAPAPPAGGARAPMPPPILVVWIYGVPGALSLLVIPFKLIGAVKLLRRGINAWGWGLAAAILQCIELWQFEPCCFMFVLPLGAGVYTIIILCFAHVRRYLQHNTAV